MQQLREKAGLPEAPRLCAAAKSQQVRHEEISLHFWNSSGALQDRLLEMSLMLTHCVE